MSTRIDVYVNPSLLRGQMLMLAKDDAGRLRVMDKGEDAAAVAAIMVHPEVAEKLLKKGAAHEGERVAEDHPGEPRTRA